MQKKKKKKVTQLTREQLAEREKKQIALMFLDEDEVYSFMDIRSQSTNAMTQRFAVHCN
jgi:hypothetical protein